MTKAAKPSLAIGSAVIFSAFSAWGLAQTAGQVQSQLSSKDDDLARALQTVIRSAEDQFRSIKGDPNLRSIGKEWKVDFRLPETGACRIFERHKVLAFECQTPFTATQELAMDRYEEFVGRIARGVGREWEYEVEQQTITSGLFTRSVVFRRARKSRTQEVTDLPEALPSQVASADPAGSRPFGLSLQITEPNDPVRPGDSNARAGVVVTGFDSNSFAEKIGFQRGDLITHINRVPVLSFEDVAQFLRPQFRRAGNDVVFRIERGLAGRSRSLYSLYLTGVLPDGVSPESSASTPASSPARVSVEPAVPAVDGPSSSNDPSPRFFGTSIMGSEITLLVRVYRQTGQAESASPGGSRYAFSFAVARTDGGSVVLPVEGIRATLGLQFVAEQDPTLLQSFGADHGVILTGLPTNGPAAKAGLQPGDVVLSVNGTPIWDGDALVSKAAHITVGQSTSINYFRNGKEREAKAVAVDIRALYPQNPQIGQGSDASVSAIDRIRNGQHSQMPRADRVDAGTPGVVQGIAVANNTSYAIQVHFRGPVSRSVKISPGGSASVDLPPGRYEEAAEALNSNIIPFYGEHFQESGAGYRVSFYITPR